MKASLSLVFSFMLLTGCTSTFVYYEMPVELRDSSKKTTFMKKYSAHLSGKKIFLDPGHGGNDRRSIGRQKLITEADANLRVSLALRDYLTEAGAQVILSRNSDATVDLKERSYMANKSGADIFISIHHNAPGDSSDYWTNYTSTYYHAKETDYEYEPCERDLAKFIQRDLAYAMRNSGGPGTFDGTYSDYFIYPGQGFSVLRLTEIPSVLVEAGFFTHPHEESRLALEEFNKIQAWGIFKGVARYFSAGIPIVNILNEPDEYTEGELVFTFSCVDTNKIDTSSVAFYFDSTLVNDYQFSDIDKSILKVNVPAVLPGKHSIRLVVANKNGNHSFPFKKEITVLKK